MSTPNPTFTIVWSFRNRIDTLIRSIESSLKELDNQFDILLIDANSSIEELSKLRRWIIEKNLPNIRLCETYRRSSLSEAWNLGIMLSESSHIVFISSDVEFISPKWFDIIKNAAITGHKYILLENHAVFCINRDIITYVGWFDEGFGIGPHFDTDYYIRVSEQDIEPFSHPAEGIYLHGHDNPEIEQKRKEENFEDRLPMHDLANEAYFKLKWISNWSGWQSGGHPPNHISMCTRSFNEVDQHPMYTLKISYAKNSSTGA